MQPPRGAVPHAASRRSAHAGRDLEKTERVFNVVVLAALVVLAVGLLLAIASLPDERSTAPAQVGPSVEYSRTASASLPASRSLERLPLVRSVVGVNRPFPAVFPTEGVTPVAHQTAVSVPPASAPSRPAPTTESHPSPSPSKVHSVPTRSPAAVSVGGTASGPTASQWAILRRCESGGLYGNKQNPHYRGAYQIGFTEWASYGGTAPQGAEKRIYTDPADAPAALQDMVALRMWQARGWQPWSSSSKCTGLS